MLKEVARIPLPPHPSEGEFDHAAVDPVNDRLYVAHPSNDAVEVVDLASRRHLRTLAGLRGIAGVWVDAGSRLLFTSNRGEDTASIFQLEEGKETELFRVPTGTRPNGMAFDAGRGILMVAGVGNPKVSGAPPTLTFVDARTGQRISQIEAPGRTRWALYHPPTDAFYVNVADPPMVAAIPASAPTGIAKRLSIPALGPHGLEQDPGGDRLFCACDEGVLLALSLGTGQVDVVGRLAGAPDVLWLDRERERLYCAIGEPGTVEVFGLRSPMPRGRTPTGPGAHTLTVDPRRGDVHVFLPESHEDLILNESET